MALIASKKILEKLASKHGVSKEEVEQCFANRSGSYLFDSREDHQSNPPTLWFISETYFGRRLKIVFIQENADVYLRTAFPPNETEERIYKKYGEGN